MLFSNDGRERFFLTQIRSNETAIAFLILVLVLVLVDEQTGNASTDISLISPLRIHSNRQEK